MRQAFGLGAWRDLASPARRRFGVPVGGPWDREAARISLAATGLHEDRPVFELLHGTVQIEALAAGTLSAVGIDGGVTVGEDRHPLNCRLPLSQGQVVTVQARIACLAWTDQALTFAKLDWRARGADEIRYLPAVGPGEMLELKVSSSFSRAGVRLTGLPPQAVPERPSEPCCIGAIQQTPGGELIVIGPDGPTIGGYPRLGYVIEADHALIPRLKMGQSTRFSPVDFDRAIQLQKDVDFQLNLNTNELLLLSGIYSRYKYRAY